MKIYDIMKDENMINNERWKYDKYEYMGNWLILHIWEID